jgi:thiol-disulfide isomerase/thioredoxin
MRADILIRLGRPAEALVILQPHKNEFTLGCSFYVYGKALDDSGDKRNAVESYLQAAVRASQCQQPASAALARIWQSEKLGSGEELQRRLESTTAQNFSNAKYTPRLLAHALPDFDLTTLAGEHLSNDRLRGKKLILDFWAVWCGPCLGELKALQDFQESHPDVVVLTVVDSSADPKQLKAVIHDRKLASLRVSLAPRGLWEQFGTTGVPDTLVIDESGFVRIQHSGAVPDVQRYLDADLQAISAAGSRTTHAKSTLAALPDNAAH